MHDDPIDLTPLDPDMDPSAEDRFVGSVMSRVGSSVTVYPMPVDALWGAWSLAKPVLIAASIAIAVAGSFIARATSESGAPRTVAESVGLPLQFQSGLVVPPGAQPR
jgi:hypothetical protein